MSVPMPDWEETEKGLDYKNGPFDTRDSSLLTRSDKTLGPVALGRGFCYTGFRRDSPTDRLWAGQRAQLNGGTTWNRCWKSSIVCFFVDKRRRRRLGLMVKLLQAAFGDAAECDTQIVEAIRWTPAPNGLTGDRPIS